jgi:hypothetical protein
MNDQPDDRPEPRLDAVFLAQHVGDTFTLSPLGVPGDPADAVLTHCDTTEQGFRLTLLVDPPLEQATYGIRGHGLDDVVFLVPIGRSGSGTVLEAIFTHIEGALP